MAILKIEHDAEGTCIKDYAGNYEWGFYMPDKEHPFFIYPDQVFSIDKITKSFSSTDGRSIIFHDIVPLLEDLENRPEREYCDVRQFYLFRSANEIERENIKFSVSEGSEKLLDIETSHYKDSDFFYISMTLPKKTFEELYNVTIPKNHSLYLTIKDFISPSNGFYGCMHMPDRFSPYVKCFDISCYKYFSKKDYDYLFNMKKKEVNDFKFHFSVNENPDLVDAEIAEREYEQEVGRYENPYTLFWIFVVCAIIGYFIFN